MSALAEVVDLAVIRGAHARAVPVEEYVPSFTLAEIDAEVAAIRAELVRPLQRLARLRAAGAHLTAGFASWHEAVEVWLGDLQSLRLTGSPEAVAERDALVQSMRATGAATRAIRERLGVSSYAVQQALATHDPAPERIEGADGRTRSSRTGRQAPAAPLEAPTGARWQQAAEWCRRNPQGLTLGQLAGLAGWSEGAASGALTRAVRHGAVVREDGPRGTVRRHLPVAP